MTEPSSKTSRIARAINGEIESTVKLSNFPSSGTILIDDEMISYSGKSANTLNGLTRGALNTTPFAHTSGSDIFVKANS